MKTITDFTVIECPCRWCGEKLAVIGERHEPGSISLVGFRDLLYVHAESLSPTCTRTYDAQPYNGWSATSLYEEAVRRRWAEEDAAYDDDPPAVPGGTNPQETQADG
jgi:hypothetical protein